MGQSDVEIKPNSRFKLKLKVKSKRKKITVSESSEKDFSVSTLVVPSENLIETYSR